jgi:arginine decarboxylase
LNNPNYKKTWTTQDAIELYGIDCWGKDHFSVSDRGDVTFKLNAGAAKTPIEVSEILEGLKQRGLTMPVMLRLENFVDDRITQLNNSFASAIETTGYQNVYRGVFPIKVNQQSHIIEEIARHGEQFSHGFEAGSKAELLIAMSHLKSRDCLIVCNGYKDEEFIDLGFQALQIGFKCFFVVETVKEIPEIIQRSKKWGVKPLIGVRVKLSTQVDGHWATDSGDRSLFGLSTVQLINIVDQLRDAEMLDCLQMLHFHLGSQLPNIRNIRDGVSEACRFYLDLIREGAPMGYLDFGGGLAVDYDGSGTASKNSRNYNVEEYCIDIVETVMHSLDCQDAAGNRIPHPVLISESGRWTVAPMSVLLFNVLEVNHFSPLPLPRIEDIPTPMHESVDCLLNALENIDTRRLQENYNDAIYNRDLAREAFRNGTVNLRERALAENICLTILHEIASRVAQMKRPPAALENLDDALADIYYGNFSVFQSLPDSWAINQVFPVVPLQRLNEEPTQNAVIGDLTCDCDGLLDRFAGPQAETRTVRLHRIADEEEYCIGVFLTGAYQETLGDLHNLFGDANVASVRVDDNGRLRFVQELSGDSIGDVLSYVEYQPAEILKRFRALAESAVEDGMISVAQRQQMINMFKDSLSGYTYFEN